MSNLKFVPYFNMSENSIQNVKKKQKQKLHPYLSSLKWKKTMLPDEYSLVSRGLDGSNGPSLTSVRFLYLREMLKNLIFMAIKSSK